MKSKTSRKGFTIIELLVVIAIIAILSGIIITALTGSKAKSRDAERISDLNQIQLALEQYFDRCGQYPTTTTSSGYNGAVYPSLSTSNGCPTGITFGSYISKLPKDPQTQSDYDYVINNGSTPTDYVLHTRLESPNAAQQNSYPETSLATFEGQPGFSFSLVYPTENLLNENNWGCFDPSSAPDDYCISTH